MWKICGYPLNIDDAVADQIYIGWRDIALVRNNAVRSSRTGRILSDEIVPVDDCSLSRDYCAIVRGGKCRIIGLYDESQKEIGHIDGVKQVSMMANERLALRTADEVLVWDYGRNETTSWKLQCSLIAAGFDHLVALSTEGKVHVYGEGSRGQQGSGDLSATRELTSLAHLEDVIITDISAGGWHCAALSDRGDLYQWGWNQHGQAARSHGDGKNVIEVPRYQDIGMRVEFVQCGSRHTVILTENGELHSWGWDEFGQCSKLDKTCCTCPAAGKLLRAGFWTTAYKRCEACH